MILIDTSALFAVLDRDDENHAAAKATGREACCRPTNRCS